MSKKRKKIGLALGGGGARGFCHVGVLKVFEENGIPIDFISGCSMGSIVGGCYAHGVPISEMEKVAQKFKSNTITDFDPLFRNQGLFRGNRAASFLKKFVGDAQIEDCGIPFAATAVDIKKAELVVMKSGSLVEAMRASFSIPIAFQCVSACGRDCLVDGGVIERVPINAVRDMGADIVIGVDALGAPEEISEVKNILEMLNRVFLILDWEGWQHKQNDADLIITPNQPAKMIHDFKKNLNSIEAGYEATERALPQILELIK